MADIDIVAEALRIVESGNNYKNQRLTSIGGERHRKIGAYGFIAKRWVELTNAAGLSGADWHDPAAQDHIAKAKLQRDYDKYGSWEAAAIAFRYGGNIAKAYLDGQDFEQRKEVEGYTHSLRKLTPDPERQVIGTVTRQDDNQKSRSLTQAEGVIRDRLVMMSESQSSNVPAEEEGGASTPQPMGEIEGASELEPSILNDEGEEEV